MPVLSPLRRALGLAVAGLLTAPAFGLGLAAMATEWAAGGLFELASRAFRWSDAPGRPRRVPGPSPRSTPTAGGPHRPPS